jgi:hypothetical protein
LADGARAEASRGIRDAVQRPVRLQRFAGGRHNRVFQLAWTETGARRGGCQELLESQQARTVDLWVQNPGIGQGGAQLRALPRVHPNLPLDPARRPQGVRCIGCRHGGRHIL